MYYVTYLNLSLEKKKGHLKQVALILNRSLAVCYSHMGVKTGLSGTKFLPFERPELCEGLGIHFVKVDCGISIAR